MDIPVSAPNICPVCCGPEELRERGIILLRVSCAESFASQHVPSLAEGWWEKICLWIHLYHPPFPPATWLILFCLRVVSGNGQILLWTNSSQIYLPVLLLFCTDIYFKMWGEANCLCFNVLPAFGGKKSPPVLAKKKYIWIEIRDILFRKCKSKTNRISGCHHYPSCYWNVLLYLLLVPIAGDIGKCAVCSNITLQKRIPELAGWRPDWCSWAETTPGNCSFVCLVDGDRRGGGVEEHTQFLWMLFWYGTAWRENSALVHGCLPEQQ